MSGFLKMSEEEYQKIETEMTSLCIQGINLPEGDPKHEEIQKKMKEWHEKYDGLFQ